MVKAEKGHAKKWGGKGFYHYEEIRLPDGKNPDPSVVGQLLSTDFLKEGDYVDLTAVTKGKGFQGVMKRYHFAGGYKTHGASVCHRSGGSIGNRADPGKVFKGKKMAGQMGHEQKTVQSVRIVKVDREKGVLLVHGSVPGPVSGLVLVRRAVKRSVK